MQKIEAYLIEHGFMEGTSSSRRSNKPFKYALSKFQKINNLPLGQLDFLTLDFLGIEEYQGMGYPKGYYVNSYQIFPVTKTLKTKLIKKLKKAGYHLRDYEDSFSQTLHYFQENYDLYHAVDTPTLEALDILRNGKLNL